MITIYTNDGRVHHWNNGEPKPIMPGDPGERIVMLVATGIEYSQIVTNMRGIPKLTAPKQNDPCTWRGLFAQFIFDNL